MDNNVTNPVTFFRKKVHHSGFINTFTLKIIAIICMTIDHIGACLGTTYYNGNYYLSGLMSIDTYTLLRIIGRIAFPIFCYLIVEGLFYTKDVFAYVLRLLIFALFSQIPFSLLTRGEALSFSKNLNVFFTLAIGLITISGMEYCKTCCKKNIVNKPMCVFLDMVAVVCAVSFADTINCDYAGYGIVVIVIFYVLKDRPFLITLGLLLATLAMSEMMELFALIAMIPILLHNHQKGPSMKYVFYSYYPVHMLIIYFISTLLK